MTQPDIHSIIVNVLRDFPEVRQIGTIAKALTEVLTDFNAEQNNAPQEPTITVTDILAVIKDNGEDALPASEYRLACNDLIAAFSNMAQDSREQVISYQNSPPLELPYRNWRGEIAVRKIRPLRLEYAATEWHPEPQWLLVGIDLEKGAERSFALKDFNPAAGELSPSGPASADPAAEHFKNLWREYAGDFNAMSDAEIASLVEYVQNKVDGHNKWLEAVASWEAAGRPRNTGDDNAK